MVKPAFVTKDRSTTAAMQTSGKAADERLQTMINSSSGRFPPIDNALTKIVKDKRLSEAHQNV
ncbi:hypothetical protein [uncultured Ruegeria sp.]|uniref:hypothetical protein n=1 Tax=uncultured Ruegeria sp. TaxID=259304 RepID=UPI0026163E6E|nr:hypothetical protein [uncultured Ruegeria sp.]